MKKKVDADIIIRCYNEEEWIIRCLEVIENQNIHPNKIFVIDNESNDSSPKRIKYYIKKSNLNIIYSLYINQSSKYLPGQCLNQFAKKVDSKYTVMLSAHCIPVHDKWLSNLVKSIDNDENIIASYGRQIPTKKSDARDARDLLWTFGIEEKRTEKDIFFHNANSIIRSKILQKYPFNEEITNIEDRVWAQQILSLNKNFAIKYTPTAEVFHEHGIHQSGKKKRADQIIEIVNKYTDKITYDLPKANLGCFIPFKTSDNIEKDFLKINNSIQIAKEIGFKDCNIVCSVEGNEEFIKLFNKSVFKRVTNNHESQYSMRDILLNINNSCEGRDIFFDDILLLEPNYINRKVSTIKRLIENFYQSPLPIAMIKLPIKPHIWKTTQSKTIRLDTYELYKNYQEKIILSMRGLGMIIKISQLRKKDWLDYDIEFVEPESIFECLPEIK